MPKIYSKKNNKTYKIKYSSYNNKTKYSSHNNKTINKNIIGGSSSKITITTQQLKLNKEINYENINKNIKKIIDIFEYIYEMIKKIYITLFTDYKHKIQIYKNSENSKYNMNYDNNGDNDEYTIPFNKAIEDAYDMQNNLNPSATATSNNKYFSYGFIVFATICKFIDYTHEEKYTNNKVYKLINSNYNNNPILFKSR